MEATKSFLDNFVRESDPAKRMVLIKYVIYHEAAHASVRQSPELQNTQYEDASKLDREMHSDLSAFTLIAVQDKNLDNFNYGIDTMIKSSLASTQDDNEHNTTYGLIELKKAFNENPELVNMKVEDISEFAHMINNKLKNMDFKNTNEIKTFIENVEVNKESLLENVKEGKNIFVINYFAGKIYNKGESYNIQKMYTINENRVSNILENVAQQLSGKMGYEDFSTIIYKNQGEKIGEINSLEKFQEKTENTIKELSQHIDKSSALDSKFLSVIKAKINIDDVKYDYSKISEMINNLKEKNETNTFTKIDLKNNNKLI